MRIVTESKAMMMKFDAMDADRDGKLSRDEWVQRYGEDEMFELYDADGDRSISAQEWRRAHKDMNIPEEFKRDCEDKDTDEPGNNVKFNEEFDEVEETSCPMFVQEINEKRRSGLVGIDLTSLDPNFDAAMPSNCHDEGISMVEMKEFQSGANKETESESGCECECESQHEGAGKEDGEGTDSEAAPTIVPAQVRLSILMSVRLTRALTGGMTLLCVYGLLYASVGSRIGAVLVLAFVAIVYPVCKFRHLSEIAKKVESNLPVDQPSLSVSTHLSGGLLRFDSCWCIFWPLASHYVKIVTAIVVVSFYEPVTASGSIFVLKLFELAFFFFVWPYEVRFKFDLDNRAQCAALVLVSLAYGCLFLENLLLEEKAHPSTVLDTFFKLLGLSATFMVPLLALTMKVFGSRIEDMGSASALVASDV